jgi:MFS family permease
MAARIFEQAHTETGVQARPSMFRALRHRNFRLFFSGQLVSLSGTWMQTLAQSWLVYRLTQSPALLGAVSFASQVPVLFLSPWAGIVADRHSRHRMVIITQSAMMVQALVLAALTLTGRITVWQIFVLSAFQGVCIAFDMPARQAFLIEMVGGEDLMNAIALNSSMFNSARMIGPAVAGVLVAALGEGMCFLINGVSYLAVIAGLLLMRLTPWRPEGRKPGKLDQLKEGVAYVLKNDAIRSLLGLLGVVSLLGMPYAVLMPIFAEDILRSGPRGMGGLMSAAAAGALAGALWLARRRSVRGLDRVVVRACALFGVALTFFSVARVYWLAVACLVPAGFGIMVQMGSTNSLVQSLVDNRMRGRVMGLYATMFLGVAPFGSLLAGFVAERAGAPATVALGGLACIAGAGALAVRIPRMRIDALLAGASPSGLGGKDP